MLQGVKGALDLILRPAAPMAVAITRPRIHSAAVLVLAGASAWLYAPVLADMARAWATEDSASHGFLIAPVAAYLVWSARHRVRASLQDGATAAGLALGAVAALMFIGGRLFDIEFLPPLSLVLMVVAQVAYFGGWRLLKTVAFPCAFLLFMIPWPDTLVEFLSFPMQLSSAKYATMVIGLSGLGATRTGVDIHLGDYTFSVGAPCSGMKTLIALLAVAALVSYTSRGPIWRRALVFAAGVPMALAANVVRIVVILLIAAFAGTEAAQGFFHGASGVLVFVVALIGLLGFARAIGVRGILGGARGAP